MRARGPDLALLDLDAAGQRLHDHRERVLRVLDLLDLDVGHLRVALREEVDAGLALGDRLEVVGGLHADRP
jgi:hypothetical protein